MTWGVYCRRINHVKDHGDRLSICYIGNWPLITMRNQYEKGTLVAYIPTDSIVPEELLKKIGLEGKLSGPKKNRVRAIKLRGELSIGLLVDPPSGAAEGDEVSAQLGITKYEEVIPLHMSGVMKQHPAHFIKYDLENLNNFPDWFIDGEPVSITSKGHGTSQSVSLINGVYDVHSRQCTLQEDETNLYWRVSRLYDLRSKMQHLYEITKEPNIYLHGETMGKGVQDHHYGFDPVRFFAFDIRFGLSFVSVTRFQELCRDIGIDVVPEVYRGPYSWAKVQELAKGQEVFSGKSLHVQEGVVIKPLEESYTVLGRKALKYVSPEYLMLKDNSEFH